MCDDNGILLGVNKHNNSLIIVDIFDSRVYKNANIAILGTSGAGKTFTLQLMALRMRRKGIQVFIIAPLKGHEFHRACSNIGGQFISISPASQNCINIMEIRKADKSVDDLLDGPGAEKSLLAAKIQRLHTFFSLLIPDMSHEERQLLDDAMICTYGVKGITHDNASLEQPKNPGCYKEMPILGDLYEILAASPETKRLANILNRLVNGSARSFNQQTNVALDNKYIVLDISELTGDLLTVGMFVALDFVWDKAKENRTAEKAIFVDECWQLIGASSNRQAAESVLELAKMIRGYPDNYEVLSTDAALRAERITCRLRHLIYATTSIKKEEYLRSAETMQGIEISENDGILEIKLPCLLPKRRQRQSTEFLLDPFTSALSDYAAHHTMPQFQHCVVCFSHIYAQELPERRIRDYDNLELKQFLDVAASFILTDDNGLLCDAYNTTELGEEDCTRLFLMDSTQFPAWLAERQNGVKSISDF